MKFSNMFLCLLLPNKNEIKIVCIVAVYDEKTLNDFFIRHLMTVKTEMAQNFIYSNFYLVCYIILD